MQNMFNKHNQVCDDYPQTPHKKPKTKGDRNDSK